MPGNNDQGSSSLLDHKKKLLREFILENSSSAEKRLQNGENQREFGSLRKYLDQQSSNEDINPYETKKANFNDSDIAGIWVKTKDMP